MKNRVKSIINYLGDNLEFQQREPVYLADRVNRLFGYTHLANGIGGSNVYPIGELLGSNLNGSCLTDLPFSYHQKVYQWEIPAGKVATSIIPDYAEGMFTCIGGYVKTGLLYPKQILCNLVLADVGIGNVKSFIVTDKYGYWLRARVQRVDIGTFGFAVTEPVYGILIQHILSWDKTEPIISVLT